MKPVSRRRRPSRPALAVASLGAGLLLLLSACASGGAKRTDPAAAIYLAPLHVEVGHVISYDAKAGTALVVIGPFAKTPAKLAGQSLIARHPETLEPSARLVASAHRTGSVFGAYVLEGAPSPNDEIVIPPATETSADPATPSEASTSTPATPAP